MRSSTLDVALGVGTTPMRATVSRTRGHVVSVAYDTFPASDVLLQRHVSLWVAANWYLFALPAMVDFGNGAAYTFLTDSVFARFPGSGGPADIRNWQAWPRPRGASEPDSRARVPAGLRCSMVDPPYTAFLASGSLLMCCGQHARRWTSRSRAGDRREPMCAWRRVIPETGRPAASARVRSKNRTRRRTRRAHRRACR